MPTCVALQDGIALTPENFDILMRTMDRDCRVLESFSIMDFSLLLGVHYIDHGLREQFEVSLITRVEVSLITRVEVNLITRVEVSLITRVEVRLYKG